MRNLFLGCLKLITFVIILAINHSAFAVDVQIRVVSNAVENGGSGTPGTFVVYRSDSGPALLVNLLIKTSQSTAVDADYSFFPNPIPSITIPANELSVTFQVIPKPDSDKEGVETLTIEVTSGGAFYNIGLLGATTMDIEDDDVQVSMSIQQASTIEDTGSSTPAILRADFSAAPTTFDPFVTAEIITPVGAGYAVKTTDYAIRYKIGGNAYGAGINYTLRPRYFLKDSTQVTISGGTVAIPNGASIAFSGHGTTYTTSAIYAGGTGALSFTPGLTANVENAATVTVTPNLPTGFMVNQSTTPPIIGDLQVVVNNGTGIIPPGSIITFNNHVTNYTTTGLNSTSGTLILSSALTSNVPHGTAITINYPIISGYIVSQATSEPNGSTTVLIDGGTGGLAIGDVFRFGSFTQNYVVTTAWDLTTKSVSFKKFPGGGGLTDVLTGNVAVISHFDAAFSGPLANQVNLQIPRESKLIDYAFIPVVDSLAEGAEQASFGILTNPNYKIVSPTASSIIIKDDDVIASIDRTQTVNATEGGFDGSFLLKFTFPSGSTSFPGNVRVPFFTTVSNDPMPIGNNFTILNQSIPGEVLLPAGSNSFTVNVRAEVDGDANNETLNFTLLSSSDYKLIATPGVNEGASDSLQLNDPLGLVSIVATVASGRERPATLTPEKASFTVSIDTVPASDVTIPFTIAPSSTAIEGTDFQTLTKTVTILQGTTFKTFTVDPIDDIVPENTETVTITLTPGFAYLLDSTKTSASVSIVDDEPILSISTVNDKESTREGGTASPAQMRVSYAGVALGRSITVPLTYSGTASSTDHTGAASFIIPANSNEIIFDITATQDTIPEGDETLIATITSNPSVYTIFTATSGVAIIDDEPVLKIEKVVGTTLEDSGTPATFRIYYDGAALGRDIIVSLTYPTTDATAILADLTTAPPTTVTIPSTSNQFILSVLAKKDGLVEGTETFVCEIAPNATIYTIKTSKATIEITDRIPVLSLNNGVSIVEGATYNFTINSSFAPETPFAVTYTITGDATAGAAAGTGVDYKTLSGTVTISETTTTIPLQTFADTVFDPFELVTITLTNATPPSFTHAGTEALSSTVQILDGSPSVVEVTTTNLNGTYIADNTIFLRILFTEPIVVTGTPLLLLETGLNDTTATYNSLSGDSYTMIFRYVVRTTDSSPDLDYASINALSLNGGSIRTLFDGVAVGLTMPAPSALGSLSSNANLVINGGTPTGKPAPGAVSKDGGGGCGLGSGFATMLLLFMALGIRLRIFSKP